MSLQETLSEKTGLLHARNLTAETVHADPVKRGYKQLEEVERELLLDRLAEEGVEVVAQRDLPVAPYVPLDEPTLRKEDLEFLRTGYRPVEVEEPGEDESDEFGADNQRLEQELEHSGPVGLSTEELNQMLDF